MSTVLSFFDTLLPFDLAAKHQASRAHSAILLPPPSHTPPGGGGNGKWQVQNAVGGGSLYGVADTQQLAQLRQASSLDQEDFEGMSEGGEGVSCWGSKNMGWEVKGDSVAWPAWTMKRGRASCLREVKSYVAGDPEEHGLRGEGGYSCLVTY
eukprot:1139689-Pelagomonas_calceolata.AAC.1